MKTKFLGAGLYVKECGDGPPIFLLHGIGADADTWTDLMERLGGRFRMLAWDAPGYHRSEDPLRPLTPLEYGRAAAAVLEAAGVARAVLVGHSFGGLVALECAAAAPEKVAGLVLIDASLGHARATDAVRDATLARRIHAIEDLGAEEMARARTPELLSDAAPDRVRDAVERIMRRVRAPGYISAARAIHDADELSHLTGSGAPLLIIWGGADTVTPLSEWDLIRSVRPDAETMLLAGSGHLSYLEAPEAVAVRIGRFAAEALEGL